MKKLKEGEIVLKVKKFKNKITITSDTSLNKILLKSQV